MAAVPRRTAKVVRAALAVPGVIIAVAGAALLGSPAIAQAAVGAPASTAQHAVAAQHAAGDGARRDRAAGGGAHPADPGRPGGHLLRPWHRRHRRPAGLLQRGVQRLNR